MFPIIHIQNVFALKEQWTFVYSKFCSTLCCLSWFQGKWPDSDMGVSVTTCPTGGVGCHRAWGWLSHITISTTYKIGIIFFLHLTMNTF